VDEKKQPLADRRKALEDEFFRKENERLRDRLRARKEQDEAKAELRRVSGIEDDAILDRLAGLGIRADTLAAVSIVPLVEVAWADGRLEAREKEALLEAAKDVGIDPRHPAYELFANWLVHRPEPRMLDAWSAFVRGLGEALGEAERGELERRILGRARRVAEAAGGILGLGNKISPEEEKMLGVLAKAFED